MLSGTWLFKNWRGAFVAVLMAATVAAVPLAIDAAQSKSARRGIKAAAASPAAKPVQTDPYKIEFQEVKLKNGLRVLLAEDHHAPTYSISVTYNVGSRDEKPGRTGFAHLFEHMLFRAPRTSAKASTLS